MTSKKKLERANAIHAHEQQVIAAMRDAGTVVVAGLHDTATDPPHTLARIDLLGGFKARYVCTCGEHGIPVGCAAFSGADWAALAHEYHAMLNKDGDHVLS